MLKIKTALNPEVAKLLLDKYPVVKRRTALWFFTDELNKKWKQDLETNPNTRDSDVDTSSSGGGKRLKRNEIWDHWRKMNPESKRKYFNMAEVDEVRHKQQRSLWISEIASLLNKHGDELEKLSEHLPDLNDTRNESLDIDKYQKNFESMIQSQSTRMLYKDIIERTKKLEVNVDTEELISDVPEDYRHILSRPRRPAPAFILYTSENKDQLTRLRNQQYPNMTFLKVAGLRWANLSQKKRKVYEEKYDQLMKEYNEEMLIFKESDDKFLEQACREKKAFKKSLRRRLREYAVVPVNIRNAFNFFVMDNREVSLNDLTEIWRNLPEETKEKYKRMNRQDVLRYYNEKSAYCEFVKNLQNLGKKSLNISKNE